MPAPRTHVALASRARAQTPPGAPKRSLAASTVVPPPLWTPGPRPPTTVTTGKARSSCAANVERMAIQRMDHVSIVVEDLASATEFFVELGLELLGEAQLEGRTVDRVVGL